MKCHWKATLPVVLESRMCDSDTGNGLDYRRERETSDTDGLKGARSESFIFLFSPVINVPARCLHDVID